MKIDKTFVLSDDSINSYGFRILTAGLDLDDFRRNPIGYYNHVAQSGVVVRWEDLSIQDKRLTGKPNINLNNPLGQRIMDDIMNGFLNAASVWLVPKEVSSEPKDMLPGQQGATVTKWRCLECSLCDAPANANAIIVSDDNGNKLNLSGFNLKTLAAWEDSELKELLKLSGHELYMEGKFERLKELSYSDFQFKYKQHFGAFYKDKTPQLTIGNSYDKLLSQQNERELSELLPFSWDELYRQDKLEQLKQLSFADFKAKFKARFQTEYTGK